ncbi:MAG: ECF transporter S component [Clostridia bacterium]|nr:ECF transporter S component [Clostridia bacterium]
MTGHKARGGDPLAVRRMIYAALYLALALVLPFLTGQVPQIGSMLCPMHLPVLLCGFVCGWPYGLAVGLIAPVLRSLLFGMPALFPSAVAMTAELAVYGCAAGLGHRLLPRKPGIIYLTLLLSMVLGRIAWGLAQLLLTGLSHSVFTFEMFLAGAVTTALPGIILQLVLIPPLVRLMESAGLSLNTEGVHHHAVQ